MACPFASTTGAKSEYDPIHYADYLNLPQLLGAVKPVTRPSEEHPNRVEAHEEHLFMVVHQTYELWFAQIIHELNSVHAAFSGERVGESTLAVCASRLERVLVIVKLMVQQVDVLETMTPMQFLEFRDALAPASGFQSLQFRKIELMLGVPLAGRKYGSQRFLTGVFREEERAELLRAPGAGVDPSRPSRVSPEGGQAADPAAELPLPPGVASLAVLVQDWLERLPFADTEGDAGDAEGGNYWARYELAVKDMLERERQVMEKASALDGSPLEAGALQETASRFKSLFDPEAHAELVNRGARRMTRRATLAALFIFLHRDQPLLHSAFRFLQVLVAIDQQLTVWRQRHAAMAQLMLGNKVGTGGSSGVEYLARAAVENRAFKDLVNLSTFLLPAQLIPPLGAAVRRRMQFRFGEDDEQA